MSIGKDPLFRDQYSGGVRPDPEVEAALSGAFEESGALPPHLQSIADRRKSEANGGDASFGPMVKLR